MSMREIAPAVRHLARPVRICLAARTHRPPCCPTQSGAPIPLTIGFHLCFFLEDRLQGDVRLQLLGSVGQADLVGLPCRCLAHFLCPLPSPVKLSDGSRPGAALPPMPYPGGNRPYG